MQANVPVVSVGDFSADEDLIFIQLVAARRQASFVRTRPFHGSTAPASIESADLNLGGELAPFIVMRHTITGCLAGAPGLFAFSIAMMDALNHGVAQSCISARATLSPTQAR